MSEAYVVCRCGNRFDVYEIPERVYSSKVEAEAYADAESTRMREQYEKNVARWYEWANDPRRKDEDEPVYPYPNEWYVVHEVDDMRDVD